MSKMRSNVTKILGQERVISPRIRRAVHREFRDRVFSGHIFPILRFWVSLSIGFYYYVTFSDQNIRAYSDAVTNFGAAFNATQRDSAAFRALNITGLVFVAASVLALIKQWRYFRLQRKHRFSRIAPPLVLSGMFVIAHCGIIYRNPSVEEIAARRFSITMEIFCNCILRASASPATVPLLSHRRKGLKRHGRLVVAALQRAERKIDIDRDQALKEIADLTLIVCERYVEGRIGALLADDQLCDLEPVVTREWLRLLTAVALTTAGTVGIAKLGMPPSAIPYAAGGVGLLCFTALYGDGARSMFGAVRGM